jgi:hypothetical protein
MDDVGLSEVCPVLALLPEPTPNSAELMALALDHRVQAERSACPQERRELNRVADIYAVLATFDVPIEILGHLGW